MKFSRFYIHRVASEVHGTTPMPQADDRLDMHVYRAKRTTCLRCGEAFDSYDPRYNRRCAGCTKSKGQDDPYNY
jgi:hypothetical protein